MPLSTVLPNVIRIRRKIRHFISSTMYKKKSKKYFYYILFFDIFKKLIVKILLEIG